MDNCACLYDSNDGDSAVVHSEGWVRARKAHKCVECRETIPSGAQYYRFAGKWEGGFRTERTCANCHDIRTSLYCDSGWTFGCLWDDVEEQIFNETGLTIACIDKLTTPESKAFLQQRWMEYVEERGK